jgi:hypothetical protein
MKHALLMVGTILSLVEAPAANAAGRYQSYLDCYRSLSPRYSHQDTSAGDPIAVVVLSGKVAVKGKGMQDGVYIFTPEACYPQALTPEFRMEFKTPKGLFSYDIPDEGHEIEVAELTTARQPQKVVQLANGDVLPVKAGLAKMQAELLKRINGAFENYKIEKLLVAKDPKADYVKGLEGCRATKDPEILKALTIQEDTYFKAGSSAGASGAKTAPNKEPAH